MGKVSFFNLKSALFICVVFFTFSLKAVNYASTASGSISNTLLWVDSLGNHPNNFDNAGDVFAIQNGHTMLGKFNCHSSALLRIEGIWNNASGNIGDLLIFQNGSLSQSSEIVIAGNWIQNSNYNATCDSCSVVFKGGKDQYISSETGLEISFKLVKVDLNSGFNLHIKSNIVVTNDLLFENASTITVYPGFTVTVKGKIIYPYTTSAFNLLADSTGYASLLYDNGTVKAKVVSFFKGGKLGTQPAMKHYVSCSVNDQKGIQIIDSYNVYVFKSGSWVRIYNADPLLSGIGYYVAYHKNMQITYEGTLKSDTIVVKVDKNKNWTLIGNPYPCSIDVTAFLTENLNQSTLTGVLYFLNQSVSNNNDDYILLNLSGQLSQLKGNYPSGIIARSQGFWVQNSNISTSQCLFSNNMKAKGSGVLYAGGTGISRCYLGLENKNNYFNQQLLAFTDDAKRNYDKLYDAFIPDTTKAVNAFYSLVENKNTPFAIQGLNFNLDTTIVKIGYYTDVSGLLTISLEKLFSFPDSLNILLQDKDLNTITNLSKTNKYIFNSSTGRFNNRFQILIVPTSQISIEKQNRLLAKWTQTGNNLEINTQSDKIIESITIYNASGQTILSKERINMTNCNIDLNQYSGVIFVEALINDKKEVGKFIVTK